MMNEINLHTLLLTIQHGISFCGVLVILTGVLIALWRYIRYSLHPDPASARTDINTIRLNLGLVLLLGLEFIVGADLIGTTTAPDYYSIGLVACIVLIRTVLSYTLNREVRVVEV